MPILPPPSSIKYPKIFALYTYWEGAQGYARSKLEWARCASNCSWRLPTCPSLRKALKPERPNAATLHCKKARGAKCLLFVLCFSSAMRLRCSWVTGDQLKAKPPNTCCLPLHPGAKRRHHFVKIGEMPSSIDGCTYRQAEASWISARFSI